MKTCAKGSAKTRITEHGKKIAHEFTGFLILLCSSVFLTTIKTVLGNQRFQRTEVIYKDCKHFAEILSVCSQLLRVSETIRIRIISFTRITQQLDIWNEILPR